MHYQSQYSLTAHPGLWVGTFLSENSSLLLTLALALCWAGVRDDSYILSNVIFIFFNFVRSHWSFLVFLFLTTPRQLLGVPSTSLSSDDINSTAFGEVKILLAFSLSLWDKGAFSRTPRRFSSFYNTTKETIGFVFLSIIIKVIFLFKTIAM